MSLVLGLDRQMQITTHRMTMELLTQADWHPFIDKFLGQPLDSQVRDFLFAHRHYHGYQYCPKCQRLGFPMFRQSINENQVYCKCTYCLNVLGWFSKNAVHFEYELSPLI